MNAQKKLLLRHDLTPDLARLIADQRSVAWDVETTGLDWERDRLATCQLFTPTTGGIIVQVGQHVSEHLAGLLADAGVVKVFHHAPFDLRFLSHTWGITGRSIRCTKVASKLLEPFAPNSHHSLSSLLSRHLGVELDKGPIRTSSWDAEKLTDEQIEYALNDVRYLLQLETLLGQLLANSNKSALYEECCIFLPTRVQLELGRYPDVFAY